MNILITNDDGWDAPGLAILRSVAQGFGNVWSVAPLHPMSGISHQITFERPLALVQTGYQSFSLDGTPADCTRIGLTQLQVSFDWVLSGINNGGNLGLDVFVSGTVAAARESALLGVPAIALSQHRCRFKLPYDWTRTSWMAELVLERFLGVGRSEASSELHALLNVNFPDKYHTRQDDQIFLNSELVCETDQDAKREFQGGLKILDCVSDRRPIPTEYRVDQEGRYLYCGKYHERDRSPRGDIESCFGGAITVSVLQI